MGIEQGSQDGDGQVGQRDRRDGPDGRLEQYLAAANLPEVGHDPSHQELLQLVVANLLHLVVTGRGRMCWSARSPYKVTLIRH